MTFKGKGLQFMYIGEVCLARISTREVVSLTVGWKPSQGRLRGWRAGDLLCPKRVYTKPITMRKQSSGFYEAIHTPQHTGSHPGLVGNKRL